MQTIKTTHRLTRNGGNGIPETIRLFGTDEEGGLYDLGRPMELSHEPEPIDRLPEGAAPFTPRY